MDGWMGGVGEGGRLDGHVGFDMPTLPSSTIRSLLPHPSILFPPSATPGLPRQLLRTDAYHIVLCQGVLDDKLCFKQALDDAHGERYSERAIHKACLAFGTPPFWSVADPQCVCFSVWGPLLANHSVWCVSGLGSIGLVWQVSLSPPQEFPPTLQNINNNEIKLHPNQNKPKQ
jgi:hypothetical protein